MKKTSILLALIACLSVNEASAATITLDKATMLVPQGWSVADEDLKFKKDTTAELNDRGEVVSAVLNKATYLRPTGWRSLINAMWKLLTCFFRVFSTLGGCAMALLSPLTVIFVMLVTD